PPPPRSPLFPYTTLFRSLERLGVEGPLHHRGDEGVLVAEDPEDRPLRDPRRVGDLARGHHLAGLQQQGEGGVDDRLPPLVGGQRSEEHTSELQSLAYLVC